MLPGRGKLSSRLQPGSLDEAGEAGSFNAHAEPSSARRAGVGISAARGDGIRRPGGHIAMMEDEVVRRRAWISREQFMDLLGAANLIPGPNSTEVAIHIGHRELLDGRSWRSECDALDSIPHQFRVAGAWRWA